MANKGKFGVLAKVSAVVPEQPAESLQAVEGNLRKSLLEMTKTLQMGAANGLVFVESKKRGKNIRVTVGLRAE